MRSMILEFSNDPACKYLDTQYMLSDSLMIAPVFSETGQVEYYLPEGIWTHFKTNEKKAGGKFFHETHDYLSLPLYVRPNSIIAVGKDDSTVNYDLAEDVTPCF